MKVFTRTIARAACALLVYSLSATAAFAGVLKKPYLVYEGTNTSMTVLWQDTGVETTNTLSWGADTSYGMGTVTVPEYGTSNQHKYQIAGLQPSTRYQYKVADAASGAVYGTGSFVTAPADDASAVKFLGFGDTRSQPLVMEAVIQEMRKVYAADPSYQSINIQAGDWVSSDAESSWTAQWFNANPQTALLLSEQPINGVKGNHENASGYSKYFPNGPGSAQYQWLVNDLASTSKPWKVLVYHEPAWGAGTHGNNTTTQAVIDPLVKQFGIDLVYAGHNHNYARCQVKDAAEAAGDTIVPRVPYITNGGGGAPLYAVDLRNTGSYRHVVVAKSDYEYMTFEVNDATFRMKAFSVTKQDGSPLSPGTRNVDTKSTLIETVTLYHQPSLTAKADKTVLWSPDHQLVPIFIETSAHDGSGVQPSISAVVTSNEPVNGLGDGDTDPDWTTPVVDAQGNISLSLRAERQSSDVTISRPGRAIEVRGVERRIVSHPA